jgi:hypothetical protein
MDAILEAVKYLNWKSIKTCTNSSQADSHANCFKTSNVSKTHSVSILREGDLASQTKTVTAKVLV